MNYQLAKKQWNWRFCIRLCSFFTNEWKRIKSDFILIYFYIFTEEKQKTLKRKMSKQLWMTMEYWSEFDRKKYRLYETCSKSLRNPYNPKYYFECKYERESNEVEEFMGWLHESDLSSVLELSHFEPQLLIGAVWISRILNPWGILEECFHLTWFK